MKERPIIFSTPMINAILDGRKTMTRRTKDLDWINEIPFTNGLDRKPYLRIGKWCVDLQTKVDESEVTFLKCPYGTIGDKLWCRETYLHWSTDDQDNVFKTDSNYEACKADMKRLKAMGYPKDGIGNWKVIPSIHMPRTASRITLEITDIRVERLQDISEQDAINEGVGFVRNLNTDVPQYFDYLAKPYFGMVASFIHAKSSFLTLWKSIYGFESLQSNPWVWCISFKKL